MALKPLIAGMSQSGASINLRSLAGASGQIGADVANTGAFTGIAVGGATPYTNTLSTGGGFFSGSTFSGNYVNQPMRLNCEVIVGQAGFFSWGDGAASPGSGDLFLLRAAANTLALRNSTNAQAFVISRTFTDASNYSQLKIACTGSTMVFTADEAGSGVGTLLGYTFDQNVSAPALVATSVNGINSAGIIISAVGFRVGADAGITASGIFTNFTIVGGIITAAS